MGFETVVAANEKLDHDAHFPNVVLHRSFKNTVYQRDSYLAGLRQLKRCKFDLVDLPASSGKHWRDLKNFYRRRQSQLRRAKLIRQFADDCRRFFSNHILTESDHVFFTTVSELEMLGLTQYLASDPETILPVWHLQFHFNLFDGRTPEYASQSAVENLTKACFTSAFEQLACHRVRCHTTSIALAQQYNRMKVCDVTPLPYPVAPEFASQFASSPVPVTLEGHPSIPSHAVHHPHFSKTQSSGALQRSEERNRVDTNSSRLNPTIGHGDGHSDGHGDGGSENNSHPGERPADPFHPTQRLFPDGRDEVSHDDQPLRFTCPGQIRREKGCFEYLQPLVNELWESQVATGNIKIAVQRPKRKGLRMGLRKQKMQISLPQSDAADDAAGAGAIEYFDHPLGREAYIDFIKNTDCGLLFYDSRTYYSRRAGVLGELLSAGKPLIVSSGSWLCEQIAEPNFRWAQSLEHQSDSVRTLQIQDVQYSGTNVPSAGGVVSFDQQKHPFRFRLPRQPGEQMMVFTFDWKFPTQDGTYARIEVTQKDANGNCTAKKSNVVGHREALGSPNCLFRLRDDTDSLEVSLRNEFSDSTASFKNMRIDMLTMGGVENADEIPLANVGIIAADRSDLASAVHEMVRHYDHYRSSANHFSRHWFAMHNPVRCVARLIANRW